jgi:hypothetical protein
MDFSYNFHQAHQDRLEDAGVKRYGYQNTDGYVLDNDEQPKHKVVVKQVKQVALSIVQLLVK